MSLPAKEYEFTEAESARIRVTVETWDGYAANADRRWLEPVLIALATKTLAGSAPTTDDAKMACSTS
jgi:hypothetical protein